MTARAPIACARFSLATCAIIARVRGASKGLPACGIARACRVSSSAVWRAVRCPAGCAVRCCPMGTLCAGCAVLCAARGRAGICLFSWRGVVLCGGGGAAWCCPVCWSTVCASSSARHALLPAVTVLLRSLSAVCHPVGFHPLTFRARLFRLRRARSAYLAILYHYRHFHNYLLISVTYNLSDNGILTSVMII